VSTTILALVIILEKLFNHLLAAVDHLICGSTPNVGQPSVSSVGSSVLL
jgi:hypothetical protein